MQLESMDPPIFPVGEPPVVQPPAEATRQLLTRQLAEVPATLRQAVRGLEDKQLDTPYRNWTVRQIVHHVCDSHLHSFIRCKWALTESRPRIKAYEEAAWVQLADSATAAIEPSLVMLDALHQRWGALLSSLSLGQFEADFVHPQTAEVVSLWRVLHYYPWHGRHHAGQIQWLRNRDQW